MRKLLAVLSILSILCQPVQAAVTFDKIDDLLGCGTGNDVMTENGAVTISAWINPVDVGENSLGYVTGKADATDAFGFLLVATSTIELFVSGGTSLVRAASDSSITLGSWQHVLLTWDGSTTAANAHIYVNGTETSYKTTTNGVTMNDNSTRTIHIGNRANADRTFNGQIDEVAIWDSVLTAQDIAILSQSRRRGAALTVSTQPKRYFVLDECGDGATCATAGMFIDRSSTNATACSPSNSPVGHAGRINTYP